MDKPKKRAWLILILGACFVLYQFLLQSSTSVMVPQLICDLSLNTTGIGILSASFFYPYLILQIPSGILVDRFGARRVILLSIFICGLASLLFALASHHWSALISRLFMGAASAPAVVCAMCLCCHWFPKHWFAIVAGLIESIGMLGGAIGQYSLSHSVQQFGWRTTMIFCTVGALILWGISFTAIRNQPGKYPQETHDTITSLCKSFLPLIKQSQLWINCLYAGLLFSVITAFAGLWAIPFLQASYQLNTSHAATISALVFIGTAIGAPLSGYIATHMLNSKSVMLLFAMVCLLCFSYLVYIPPQSIIIVIILMFVLGLSSGAYVLSFTQVKTISNEKNRGCALGFTNMMCIALGAPILQPIIGWLLSHWAPHTICHHWVPSNYQWGLFPLFVCLVLAVIMGLLIRSTPR